jgi:SAM-dependent methyltransferase
MNQRADVYGKYSLGSGAILEDPDKVWDTLSNAEVLAGYEASMRRDLAKSGIELSNLADWHVLDVGTGRQALTFLKLGARRVSHFDISPENVERVRAHVAARDLADRLETTFCDLVDTDLGRERFDFVYLNGIVQHFSDVGRGLVNCMRALKPGGLLWLYFYRSGTFDNFVLYMLRTLVNGGNVVRDEEVLRDHYVAARLFYSGAAGRNYLTSIYMDGVFTRYARLYSAATYLKCMHDCGFEIVSSSGLDPLGREVDHTYARAATVVTLRKAETIADDALTRAAAALAPETEVDQLDRSLYGDPEILRSLELYRQLSHLLQAPGVPSAIRTLVALRLFAFLAQRTREAGYDPAMRHRDLQDLLQQMIGLVAEEYGAAAGATP